MRQRHKALAQVPEDAADFEQYDSVKKAETARYHVLLKAHKLDRRKEEVGFLTLGTLLLCQGTCVFGVRCC